jgi:hypothetical protein
MPDLVAHITDAAAAAILNERPSLEHPVGRVAGVTIELTLTGQGRVSEAHVYVERRTQGGALLARYARPGAPA